jgi:hypothetical protein
MDDDAVGVKYPHELDGVMWPGLAHVGETAKSIDHLGWGNGDDGGSVVDCHGASRRQHTGWAGREASVATAQDNRRVRALRQP